MSTLTIILSGICTQFHDDILGLADGFVHRAVFPDALNIRLGGLRLPDDTVSAYYFMPHLCYVTDGRPGTLRLPLAGAKLTVPNATGPHYSFAGDPRFSLSRYVIQPQLDDTVTTGERAMCYFDFHYGAFTMRRDFDDGPTYTQVTIETDGTPILRIEPFGSNTHDDVAIDSGQLVVTNLDYQTDLADVQYDFLLNYLVLRGGIPNKIVANPPGLVEYFQLTLPKLGNRLVLLGQKIAREGGINLGAGGQADTLRALIEPLVASLSSRDPVPDNQSCSDSQYP
jgi:hypothetical protein